jgi:toxin ParE1/3/4
MPPTHRILIQPRAMADLAEIHSYISNDSTENAKRFIARLITSVDSLAEFPLRYPVYQGHHQPSEAVRRMPVKNYLVYYRVKNNTVDIITIRHGARRQPRRFK